MKKCNRIHTAVLAVLASVLVTSVLKAQSGQILPDTKVIILVPQNLANRANYVNSGVIGSILYNSINTFIGIVPGILATNAPQEASGATNLSGEQFKKWDADYVLYGNFTLQGPKMNPTAVIEWRVWSRSGNGDVLAKNYRTLTDIEIFDVIDDIITTTAQSILKKRVGISVLAFNNFRIGGKPHAVLLNGRTVAVASNDNFSLSLKVPSDSKFRYQIKRNSDDKTVASGTVSIAPGDSTNIPYTAPSGLQLFFEQQSVHLQTDGYHCGTNRYPLGIFGAPQDLLAKLRTDPLNSGHLRHYSVNRILGWSFLGIGVAGTVLVFSLGNTNTATNLTQTQRGLLGLGTIVGALSSYLIGGMFFNFADNDLEKAVWNYNRSILIGNNTSLRRVETGFDLFSYSQDF